MENQKSFRLVFLFALSFFLYTLFIIAPCIWPFLMNNTTCYKYLGCNAGFFGYDAIQHLLFGPFLLFAIIWFCKKFPKYSILQKERWKNIVILIAIITFVALLWELCEFVHDSYNVTILHERLFNYRLHINSLDQPSNQDTMGDMFFNIFGAVIGIFAYFKYLYFS